MDVPLKKAANRIKGALAERQGPVAKNQDAAPIADAMRAFWERDMLSFAIPAHNGGRGAKPPVTQGAGTDAARVGLRVGHGGDTRGRGWGGQETAQGGL